MQLTLPACEPLTRMLPGAPLGGPAVDCTYDGLHIMVTMYSVYHSFLIALYHSSDTLIL